MQLSHFRGFLFCLCICHLHVACVLHLSHFRRHLFCICFMFFFLSCIARNTRGGFLGGSPLLLAGTILWAGLDSPLSSFFGHFFLTFFLVIFAHFWASFLTNFGSFFERFSGNFWYAFSGYGRSILASFWITSRQALNVIQARKERDKTQRHLQTHRVLQ